MQRTLVSSLALFAAVVVNASPCQLSPAAATIPGYESMGCYTEATNTRALTGLTYYDDAMTVEKCAAACTGFDYFGIEYHRECYCGNILESGSVSAPDSDCNFACPGDATESCGAGNRLNVYKSTTSVSTTVDFTKYGYRGCYTEASNGRALAGMTTRADDMTIEKCASICGAAQFSSFGVEYYVECYCGNALASGSVPAIEADCKFPCGGNSGEICGGDSRLNLYEFGSSTSTSASTTSTSSAAPTTTAPLLAYSDEGCYTEATNQRALTGLAYYDDGMTVEKCADACSAFTWFGVEYGRECYCGNTINSGSVPTSASDCYFACAGSSSGTCGAGNRLNMYQYGASTSSTTSTTSAPTSMTTSQTSTTSSTTSSSSSSSSSSSTTSISSSLTSSSSSSSSSSTTSTSSSLTSSSSSSSSSSTSTSSSLTSSSTSSAAPSTTSSSSSSSSFSSTSSTSTSSSSTSSSSSSSSSSITPSSSSSTSTTSSSSSPSTSTSSSTTSSSSSPSSSASTSSTSSTSTTSSAAAPSQTGKVTITNGAHVGRGLTVVNNYVQFDYSTAGTSYTPMSFIMAGGQPYLPSDPTMKLFLHQASSIVGVLYFETAATAATTSDPSVTCSLSSSNIVSCVASNANAFNTIWVCGAYLYMAKPTWTQSGCTIPTLQLSS